MIFFRSIVKLKKCFRSHPSISYFSNVQFYNSELISCGDPVITHSLLDYELLPKRGFPLIFHGIIGKDAQEEKSPSFFNIDEITQVKTYCLSLLENKKNGISMLLLCLCHLIRCSFMNFDSILRTGAYWCYYALPCSVLQNSGFILL